MKDETNTKEQLINKLMEMRQLIPEPEASGAHRLPPEVLLLRKEEHFHKIFEEGPLGMAIIGLDYRFVKVNMRLCQMLGYTEQELTGLTFLDITHTDDIDMDVKLAHQVFIGEIPYYNIEKRYIKKNREILWINLTASVIRDESGKPLYGLAMIEDITDHKILHEKSQKQAKELRTLYEDLNRRNKDLEILNAITQAVHQSLSLEEVYKVALDMTIALENIDMAMIYLVDEYRKEAILQAQRNIPEDYIRRVERIPYPKGVTWRVINAGRMLNIEDVQKDPDIGSVGRDLGHHGVLGIPIFLEERVIGVIWFVSYKERKFNQREVSLLSTLGNQIGVAISKAKQRKESELINKDLSALNTIATSVHRSLTLKEVYSIALDTVLGITAFDIAMVYLVDENTNEAVLQAHRGLTEDYIRRAGRILYPKGVTWRVINSGELTLIDDTQKDPDLGPAGRTLGHHTILMLPIKQEEKTIGVINFASRRVLELSSRDVNLLNAIGNQIGTAIVQAYLYEKSQKQAKELRTLYEDLNRRNKDLEILNAITQAVHQSLSLEEVYKVALDMTIALENIDMAMIYLVDEYRKEAILQAQRNIPEDYIRRVERIPYPKGVTWRVINAGRMLNIEDVQKDPDIGSVGRDLGHHGVLGIPIFLEERVIGVIWFVSYKERKFNQREVSLLSTLGNQIGVAISKAKQRKESELINKDLSALNTIATSVHRSLTLKEVYSIALDTVLGITAFDIAMVYLVDENTNEAVLQAHRALTEDYIRRAGRILYPKGVTWRVINSGELTLIDDTQKDPDLGPAGRTLGHHTILMLPIKQEEKTIGVINFASRRVLELSSRDVNLLNAIGNQIDTAIVQAYLYEKSQKQAKELRTLYEDLNRRNKDLEILNAITQAVHQSLSLEEVYKVALDMTIALENIDMAMIYLVDEYRKEAILQAQRNIPEDYIRRVERIPYPKGVTWRVINAGRMLNIEDVQKDPDIGSVGRDLGHHGVLGIPIF